MNFYPQHKDKLRVSNGVLGIDKEPIEVEEGWYLIPGYSRYLINKDYQLKDTFNGNIVMPSMRMNDYPTVYIASDADRMKNKKVDFHRLVALAFLPVPEVDYGERIEVDHLDGTRTNYKLENLEWVTKTENYKRGRIASKANSVGLIYRVVNKFNGTDCLRANLDEVSKLVGVQASLMVPQIDKSGRYSNLNGWTVVEIDLERNSGYRNPIYVWDYVDGSRFISKSFTDAMELTGVSKSGIEDSLKSSLRPDCQYIKGYKFFRVGNTPDKMVKMSLGEALFWQYIRIYQSNTAVNTPGYLVHNVKSNKVYPALSYNDIIMRHGLDLLDIKTVRRLYDGGKEYRDIKIYPIYKKDGNGLTPDVTEEYTEFMKTFNGEMVLSDQSFK